jgi:AcrR family transcriptional regulator
LALAHRSGQKEESRARILDAAGRGFRRHGFGGLGVDGLASEAGVTSGAFYAHFKSKAAAFREAVTVGIRSLHDSIEAMRAAKGAGWREAFIEFYLGERRTCALSDSCALQSLSGEVARGDDDVRAAYEVELRQVIDAAAAGLPGVSEQARRDDAIALLALLAGGVSLARAVKDPALAVEIAAAVKQAAMRQGS